MVFSCDLELTVNSVIESLGPAGLPDGDPEISIFTTDGRMRVRDGITEISYTEECEGTVTVCRVILHGGDVLIRRSGAVECSLSFREGESFSTLYSVPPYSFDMKVSTLRVRNEISERGGELSLVYLMNLGGEDRKVKMKIIARVK